MIMRKLLTLLSVSLLLCSCGKDSESGTEPPVSGGSGSGDDRLNFEFAIGFDDKSLPTYYDEVKGLYLFNILMGWSVGSDVYGRGVTQFGIEVYSSEGVDNKDTSGGSGGVRIETNGAWKYFSGLLFGAERYSWSELVIITSRNPTVELEYRCRFYDSQTNRYITSDWTKSETFTYTAR